MAQDGIISQTDSLDFNGFQRLLQQRGIPENIAYVLTLLFERQQEVTKQVDMASKTMLELATTVGNVVELHAQTQQKIKDLSSFGQDPLVSVKSEPVEN